MDTKVAIALGAFLAAYLFLPTSYTEPELKPYVGFAMQVVDENCPAQNYFRPKLIQYGFGKLGEGKIGECSLGDKSYSIIFDRDTWKRIDEKEKYIVVMHEVTHCIFGADHSDDHNSYMYSYYIESQLLTGVYSQFVETIKRHC